MTELAYPRFPVAVHLFLLREDRVLLLRRRNTGYEDGKLGLVAGHVEPGETVTGAAIREAREEVGIELDLDRLAVVGVMHRLSQEARVDFFLAYSADGEEPSNRESDKCSELLWARRSALPGDTIPYIRAAIEDLDAGRWFREFGWDHV